MSLGPAETNMGGCLNTNGSKTKSQKYDELLALDKLRKSGIITEEEFLKFIEILQMMPLKIFLIFRYY